MYISGYLDNKTNSHGGLLMSPNSEISKCPKCGGALHSRGGYVNCLNCGYEPVDIAPEVQQEVERAIGMKHIGVLTGSNKGRGY